MSASPLDRINQNVSTVFLSMSREEKLYLDGELNVTTNPAERADLSTIISFMQEQHWDVSTDENFKLVNRVKSTVGLIYQDEPLASFLPVLFFRSMKAFKNPSELERHAEKVHKELAVFYEVRTFYKKAMEDTYFNYRTAKFEEAFKKSGYTVPVEMKGVGLFSYDASWIKGTAGLQFFISNRKIFKHLNDRKVCSTMKKALQSKDPEIYKFAHQYLSAFEFSENAGRSKYQAKEFSEKHCGPIMKLLLNTQQPDLTEVINHYFPSFTEVYEEEMKYLFQMIEERETGNFNEFVDLDHFQRREAKLQKLDNEIKRSEGIYAFLRTEWGRVVKELSGRGGKYLSFETSHPTLGLVTRKRKFLPKLDQYLKVIPELVDLSIESEAREMHLLALTEKPIEQPELPIPLKEVSISPKTLDWKEKIAFSGGIKKPLNYADRVLDWFDDPEKALNQDRYANKGEQVKERVTFFHAFPRIFDQFVSSNYCFHEQTDTEDRYAIPVEIHWYGKVYRGFLQYTVDRRTDICYHRCYGDKTNYFAESILMNKVWEASDFPSLEEARLLKTKKPEKVEVEKSVFHHDAVLGTMQYKIPQGCIYVFKTEESCSQ